MPHSLPEIEGGTLSVTEKKEKKKDWSWSILVVGSDTAIIEKITEISKYLFLVGVRRA